MLKEIKTQNMSTQEMREYTKLILEEMEQERHSILEDLKEKNHPNLPMATEAFEMATSLNQICIKILFMDNEICAQTTSILVAILNGVNEGNVMREVENLFNVQKVIRTAVNESPKNKTKMN